MQRINKIKNKFKYNGAWFEKLSTDDIRFLLHYFQPKIDRLNKIQDYYKNGDKALKEDFDLIEDTVYTVPQIAFRYELHCINLIDDYFRQKRDFINIFSWSIYYYLNIPDDQENKKLFESLIELNSGDASQLLIRNLTPNILLKTTDELWIVLKNRAPMASKEVQYYDSIFYRNIILYTPLLINDPETKWEDLVNHVKVNSIKRFEDELESEDIEALIYSSFARHGIKSSTQFDLNQIVDKDSISVIDCEKLDEYIKNKNFTSSDEILLKKLTLLINNGLNKITIESNIRIVGLLNLATNGIKMESYDSIYHSSREIYKDDGDDVAFGLIRLQKWGFNLIEISIFIITSAHLINQFSKNVLDEKNVAHLMDVFELVLNELQTIKSKYFGIYQLLTDNTRLLISTDNPFFEIQYAQLSAAANIFNEVIDIIEYKKEKIINLNSVVANRLEQLKSDDDKLLKEYDERFQVILNLIDRKKDFKDIIVEEFNQLYNETLNPDKVRDKIKKYESRNEFISHEFLIEFIRGDLKLELIEFAKTEVILHYIKAIEKLLKYYIYYKMRDYTYHSETFETYCKKIKIKVKPQTLGTFIYWIRKDPDSILNNCFNKDINFLHKIEGLPTDLQTLNDIRNKKNIAHFSKEKDSNLLLTQELAQKILNCINELLK